MTASNTTVDDENPVVQYTASSGQTIFDAPWLFFDDADLTVYLTPVGNDADDTADLLTLTTDYTVTNTDTETGGTIILNSGATTNDIITIYRVMTLERQTDYQASGDLLAETLNKEQDTAMMILQQLRESIGRALGFKRTETSTASLQIPSPVAGYVLAWNSGATALENKLWHDASDVATNTANIATNTADIATNTSDISTNTSAIATKASTSYVDSNFAGLTASNDFSGATNTFSGVNGIEVEAVTPSVRLEPDSATGNASFSIYDGIYTRCILAFYGTNGDYYMQRRSNAGAIETTFTLDSDGVTSDGKVNGASVHATNGATGTFTNSITVVDGIVTAGT